MPNPTMPIFRSEDDLAQLPASERIRYRLVGADCRYHANDNIAAFIRDGETRRAEGRGAGSRCRACSRRW